MDSASVLTTKVAWARTWRTSKISTRCRIPRLQRVVLNVYRNQLKKPYFNPETMTLKDYDTLVRDFRALEENPP